MPGNEYYRITYHDSVVTKDIPALRKTIKQTIKRAIENRLTIDPIGFGKPLRYSLKGHRRLRDSDYSIIYRIDPDHKKVIILAIKHRRMIYKDL